MCLAIFKPKNKAFPKTDLLKNAWENNPDGAGLAIVENDHVKIIKGIMTFKALKNILKNNDLKNKDVVLHFRWSTSGTIIPELTHPFPVSRSNKDLKALSIETEKAIIHNGVMFSPIGKEYSDTAIFSKYMALKKDLSNEEIKAIIGVDRMAIATISGVELIGSWSSISGVMFSNTYSIEPKIVWDAPAPKFSDSAFWDSRKEEKGYLSSFDDPFYWSENAAMVGGLEYCPHCDSDNTELIGINQTVAECLDCGSVYNDTHFLEAKNNNTSKLKKRA